MTKSQPTKKAKGSQPEVSKQTNNRDTTIQPEEPEAGPSQPRRLGDASNKEAESYDRDQPQDVEPIPSADDIDRLLAEALEKNARLKAKAELKRLQEENRRLRLGGQPLAVSMHPAAESQPSPTTRIPMKKYPIIMARTSANTATGLKWQRTHSPYFRRHSPTKRQRFATPYNISRGGHGKHGSGLRLPCVQET